MPNELDPTDKAPGLRTRLEHSVYCKHFFFKKKADMISVPIMYDPKVSLGL